MLLSEFEYDTQKLNKIIDILSTHNSGSRTASMNQHVKKWAARKEHIFQKFGQQLKIETEVSGTLSKQSVMNILHAEFIKKIEKDVKFSLVVTFLEIIVTPEEISQNYLNQAKTFFGAKFSAGMKISRILPQLVSKGESNFINIEYSKVVQKFSFTGTAVLSIDPIDYITMSENSSNWRSCHSLDGEYSTGTLAYMLDTCSVVGYVKTKDTTILDISYSDKIWRQMVLIGEEYAVQSRQYPNTNSFNAGTISQMLINIFGEGYSSTLASASDLQAVVYNMETDMGSKLWYNDIHEGSFNKGRLISLNKYQSMEELCDNSGYLNVGVQKIYCACGCCRELESSNSIYYENDDDDEDDEEEY